MLHWTNNTNFCILELSLERDIYTFYQKYQNSILVSTLVRTCKENGVFPGHLGY